MIPVSVFATTNRALVISLVSGLTACVASAYGPRAQGHERRVEERKVRESEEAGGHQKEQEKVYNEDSDSSSVVVVLAEKVLH